MQRDERTDWQPVHLEDGTKAYLEVAPRGGHKEVGILKAIPFDWVTSNVAAIKRWVTICRKARGERAFRQQPRQQIEYARKHDQVFGH